MIGVLLEGAIGLGKKWLGMKEKEEEHAHKETMGAYGFEQPVQARNWFDSLINGLNRLPRPLFAFWVMWLLFVGPMWMYDEWNRAITALASLPDGVWNLVSIVIGFYFAGRMQIKSQDFKRPSAKAKEKKPEKMENDGWSWW